MSELFSRYSSSKIINKCHILLKNYCYSEEVRDLLNIFTPNKISKVTVTDSYDKIYITEESVSNSYILSFLNKNSEKRKIVTKITELFLLLDKLISSRLCFNKYNLLINERVAVSLYNWYDAFLKNEKISEFEYRNSISLLYYSIIEEENNSNNINKSIYEMAKSSIKLSDENKEYENILNKLMKNNILLEEIELELENEYDKNYYVIKEREFKDLELYYDCYHPVESKVKKWINREIENIVSNNSDQIELWNCKYIKFKYLYQYYLIV